MVQYMSDTGLLPGTTHDISMIAAKLGVAGALQDVKINHPNDLVSLIMFSRPPYSGEPVEVGQFGLPQISMTKDVNKLSKRCGSRRTAAAPMSGLGTRTACKRRVRMATITRIRRPTMASYWRITNSVLIRV